MFWSSKNIPEYEKIDQIHEMLLEARNARRLGVFIRILIIGGLIYGYHYFSQPEHAEQKAKVMAEVRSKFSEFVTPLVNDIMADVISNMQWQAMQWASAPTDGAAPAAGTPQITPEMIRAVQESMQKQQPQQ